nr:uncharacterized protein LOC117230063 isoform X1 [Megalopta genalis]XP_033343024.1 uncharacterized protein LOC117230063 isoform X1 [Megalopta genalis]XP_033343025.1 uncharacterized protein LOC117230063 isoform X1 [Megalopta genalis]XP_033343026.1 uncharacterized protein LOC117230063 isoform X1 [Megalopta genalis]
MNFLINSKKCDEINNKDKEHILSFEMDKDYKFKYTPESHFKHVVKSVQRQRCKDDEERIWTSFVKEQEFNNVRFPEKNIHLSMQSVKDLIQENIQDVDRELKRLQEDALPERNKGICNCKLNNRNENITSVESNSVRNNSANHKLQRKNKGAYDTNILIPISQEDITDYQDFKTSKTMLKPRTKKSLSDSSIIQKNLYTGQLLQATNHFGNDSDSDSNLSDNRMDVVHVQADPFTIHKLLSMQKKVSTLLNEISFRLSKIPLPDGNDDLKRRQQQTTEFAVRFSRNYLYNLNRLLTSIRRHIGAVSSRTKQYHRSITFHQDMIKQKLIAAYQLLIQALNAYCKHIPNSIHESQSTKLQNVLQVVSDLKDICNKVEITTNCFCSGDVNAMPVEKDPQDDIDTIVSKLKLNLQCKEQSASRKHIETTVTPMRTSLQNGRQLNKKKNLSSRLSMYSIDVPKTNQRKSTDLKGKNNHRERKCKVVDTKNVHVQHFAVPELLYPSPATHTSSSRDTVLIDCSKKMNYLKDDDIKTMMDEVPIDSENDSNLEIQTKRSNMTRIEQPEGSQKKSFIEIWKLRSTKDNKTDVRGNNILNDNDLVNKVTTITKEHLSTLVPVISDLMTLITKKKTDSHPQPISETSMETLMKFLQKYQSPKDSDTQALLMDDSCKRSYFTANSSSEIQKRNNNVQLICMSSMDKNSKTRQCDVSCQADETAINIYGDKKATHTNNKHKLELTISKEAEQRILAYRHEYSKACQSRPMYSSNTQNKPWDIVAWISDKLVEELIMETAKELEPVGVIQKLYEMEFQEF